jgi:hypothetical protein
MRGLQSVATGQCVLEAIEAAQAVRRGDLCRTPGPHPRGADTAADRARTEALIFLLTARDLRLPGHAPAVC